MKTLVWNIASLLSPNRPQDREVLERQLKTTHWLPSTGNTEGRLNKKRAGRDYIGINK